MGTFKYKTIVVKVGSNVLTNADRLPDEQFIDTLVGQLVTLKKKGVQVVLVSSGAMAAGRSMFTFPDKKKVDTVSQRQLLSSIGQVKLINIYAEKFEKWQMLCAQVLVTRQDFRDRNHYRNMQNCMEALLSNDIIPIINENDVVSVTELMFTDNDELAGLVAGMINADALFILTNVDGIYDGNPAEEGSKLIEVFENGNHDISEIASSAKSHFGRGGIITKCHNAVKAAHMGIPTVIANGKKDDVIVELAQGKKHGTYFVPGKKSSGVKKWIAHSRGHEKGEIIINKGASEVLKSPQATSLLPIGVIEISGAFKKGDIVRIMDESGKELGMGMAQYSSKKAESLLGKKNQPVLIHYDHLYLHS